MICKNCGKLAACSKTITRTCGKGDDLLVIEDVPVTSCHSCGIDLISAATFHALNKLRASADVRAAKWLVAVVSFSEAIRNVNVEEANAVLA